MRSGSFFRSIACLIALAADAICEKCISVCILSMANFRGKNIMVLKDGEEARKE